jgi:acyl-CoA thioesterase FadM
MNLLFRLLMILRSAMRRSALGVTDVSVVTLTVLPSDLDLNIHMNNGRYLSLMDLGRVDLMVRAGLWKHARAAGWFPVVAALRIDYRRSLMMFERYDLKSRVIGWDERWFYIEQEFVRGDKLIATATLKTMLRSKDGAVSTHDVLKALGIATPSPVMETVPLA